MVHLMRHCKRVECGYTLREFAHAIYPEKMNTDPMEDGGWGPYYALKNIHHMFSRFRKDVENHEILLLPRYVKLNGIGRWYYYNMIEDKVKFDEYELRQAKILLGEQKIWKRN